MHKAILVPARRSNFSTLYQYVTSLLFVSCHCWLLSESAVSAFIVISSQRKQNHMLLHLEICVVASNRSVGVSFLIVVLQDVGKSLVTAKPMQDKNRWSYSWFCIFGVDLGLAPKKCSLEFGFGLAHPDLPNGKTHTHNSVLPQIMLSVYFQGIDLYSAKKELGKSVSQWHAPQEVSRELSVLGKLR